MPEFVVGVKLPEPIVYPEDVQDQKPPLLSTGAYVMSPVWALESM
jgi:hypothetical protein